MIGHRREHRVLNLDWKSLRVRRAYNAEQMRVYRQRNLRHFVASARVFGIAISKRWQDVAAKFLRR